MYIRSNQQQHLNGHYTCTGDNVICQVIPTQNICRKILEREYWYPDMCQKGLLKKI